MNAKRTRRIPWLLALAGWLGASAFVFATDPVVFSHKIHVTDQQLECTDCHDVEAEGGPALAPEGCLNCHDETMGSYSKKVHEKTVKMAFDHRSHTAKVTCLKCHTTDFSTEASLPGTPARTYEACASCHSEMIPAKKALDCASCHGSNLKQERPADHQDGWTMRHGNEATWREFASHGKECTFCHGRNGCKSCHRSQKPRSHTAVWRKLSHGKAAGWDRSSCRTCHETGTCIRCHRSVKPSTHVASWQYNHELPASLERESCALCHAASYCARCHRDTRP